LGCHLRALALIVEMHRLHRPRIGVVAVGVVARGLLGVAVEQRAQAHRMRQASHFVLDGEQVLAGVEIDDVAEAVLELVVLAVD
jgi:hypothetical protein